MYNGSVSKSALLKFMEKGSGIYAAADINFEITWCSRNFNQIFGYELKGKSLFELFPSLTKDKLNFTAETLISLPEGGSIFISPVNTESDKEGFIIELKPEEKKEPSSSSNLLFQKEMQNILTLLIKENSLDILIEEILHRTVSISKSTLGLVIVNHEKKDSDVIFIDPENRIKNINDIQSSVLADFTYLSKWFRKHKKPLLVKQDFGTLGYSLTESLNISPVVVAPCFFDEKLVAALILGKNKVEFSQSEIQNIEQFAILLSFAITSITTRELNTALENRLTQAQKLETIGKLASGMAHDFSNLLSSIFGSLNLLKKRVPPREEITRLLDNIENCSIRAKDLTKGLLSYGKPTPKRRELIKPQLLINELSKVIEQTFPKQLEFEKEAGDDIYDILGNGTEIYQVLLNLCVNAKEAIVGKGKITLTCKNYSKNGSNAIEHPLLENGNYVCFTVQDSGTGIKEENIQKIFDPYFSTKEKETGSGLGLYVTYGIIKAHNGHIEVSSTLNVGTKFEVFIPAYEPLETEKVPTPDKIILLADDEVMLRDLLAELLESNGYYVVKVSTGKEALKVLTEEIRADLAIIDYNMPEMNGLELIEKIRELKFKMPVILSSGSISIEKNYNPAQIGVNSILSKPYEFESMLSTIKKLI